MIGMRGSWSPCGHVDRVTDAGVAALERRATRLEHPGDDLEVVAEGADALADRREAVAVGPPLVFLPAGPDAELEAAAADDVDGRRHLGRHRRVPEPGAHDHVPEADPLGGHRQRGEHRERLEGDLVRRVRDRVEVVEHPERLEAERLGVRGSARSSAPRRPPAPSRRTRPSSPAGSTTRPASVPPASRVDAHGDGSADRRVGRAVRRRSWRRLSCLDGHHRLRSDPTAPPARPSPWASTDTPSRRDGPPFHMTDMIAAEPAIVERIVAARRGAGQRRGDAGRRRAPGPGRRPSRSS